MCVADTIPDGWLHAVIQSAMLVIAVPVAAAIGEEIVSAIIARSTMNVVDGDPPDADDETAQKRAYNEDG